MTSSTRHQHALATLGVLLASTLTTLAVFASITLLFQLSGRTPWVSGDRAQTVAHCVDRRGSAERHECLRAAHDFNRLDARVAVGVSNSSAVVHDDKH